MCALILQIRANTKQAERAIRDAAKKGGAQIKTLEKRSVASSKNMTGAFRGVSSGLSSMATIGIAGAAVFAGKQILSMAANFKKSMAEVSTLVDTNVVDMGKLNDAIVDLSTRVPQTAVSLSQGLYQTISAGITNTADALKVLEISSKAATGGITDTFTSVDAITTIINAYGKDVNEASAVSDIFFNTVKEGKTTFSQLAGSIGRAAPIAAQAGVSFGELSAAVATLTKGGLSTDEAMTAIRATMVSILKPGKEAKDLAESLGLQFDAQALKAKGLSGFLQDVADATGGDIEQITKLFPNVRALTGVLSLAGKQSEEFSRILGTMQEAQGAADEAFKKMNETATSQWQLFKNQLNSTILELGDVVLPIATESLKAFNQVMNSTKQDTQSFVSFLKESGSGINFIGAIGFQLGQNARQAILGTKEEAEKLNKTTSRLGGFATFAAQAMKAYKEQTQKAKDETQKTTESAKKLNKTVQDFSLSKEQIEAIKKVQGIQTEATAKILAGRQELSAVEVNIADVLDRQVESNKTKTLELDKHINRKQVERIETELLVEAEEKAREKAIAIGFASNIIASGFEAALFQAQKLEDVLANILKQLASRALFSLITGGISSAFGIGSFGANFFKSFLGFQHGGQFQVRGSGGPDSQLVAFRATPGETVTVIPSGQTTNNKAIFNITINTSKPVDKFFIENELATMINSLVRRKVINLSATSLA